MQQYVQRTPRLILGAIIFGLAHIGCGAAEDVDGMTVFTTADVNGNTLTCAACHSHAETDAGEFRRVGHPLDGATKRASYKNGQLSDMLDAVNTCRQEWMATTPWTENDPEWEALFTWLDTSSSQSAAEAISYTIALADALTQPGEVTAGRELFNESCAACHGLNAVGTTLAPVLDADALDAQGGAAYITRRVRTSGLEDSPTYDGLTGGRMPFWSKERLSDDELRDLISYLMSNEPVDDSATSTNNTVSSTRSGLDEIGDCPSTHPNVGQVAELSTKFHGVDGVAKIINDCTIEISEFDYDGKGITVQLYTAQDSDFSNGTPVGPDLISSQPYQDETVYFVLPDGHTLDDFNSISIWCVDAAADFGSGTFAAP